MSRGAERGASSVARRLDLAAKAILPAAAALTLLAVVRDSARSVDRELLVTAPTAIASPGSLPVRALLYVGLNRPEGAQLVSRSAAIELVSASGRQLAAGQLAPSFAHSLDGTFALAAGYEGEATLRVQARDGEATLRVERKLVVGPARGQGTCTVEPRKLPPLAQLSAGPVMRASPDAAPPSALALAIEGGACVPEQPCELFLHVGSQAAALRVEPTPSVSLESNPEELLRETEGVVHLRVRTHGPEAELHLSALRSGATVATRAYRLAVALGTDAMAELPALPEASAQLRPALLGDENGCIVDAFLNERWMGTGRLRECRGHEALPFAMLEPGLWRLQLRRDPFGSESAAVRTLYLRAKGESPGEALVALARAVRALPSDDALASRILESGTGDDALEPTARYLLSRLDTGVARLPEPSSSLPADLTRLAGERARLRKLALLAIALCALALSLLVAQRGLRSAAQAGQLMAQAGEDAATLDRQRVRMVLRVLLTVLSLLLAFAAIAAYMVARSHGP